MEQNDILISSQKKIDTQTKTIPSRHVNPRNQLKYHPTTRSRSMFPADSSNA